MKDKESVNMCIGSHYFFHSDLFSDILRIITKHIITDIFSLK